MLIKTSFRLLALSTVLSLQTTASYANSEAKYRESISKIGKEISHISKKLNKSKTQLKSESQELFETEQKLAKLGTDLRNGKKELERSLKESEELSKKLAEAQGEQSENREALKKLLVARYKYGDENYLKLLLNQENPYAVGRLNNYHDYFSDALQQRMDLLKEQIIEIAELKTNHDRAIQGLEEQQQRQAEQQAQWSKTKKARAKSVARLNQKVTKESQQLDRLKQDRERLNKLLKQIARQAAELKRLEEQRRKEEEKLAARENRPPKIVRPPVKGGFNKQKGRLRYPVAGKQLRRYGSRVAASGMKSDGVFFDTNGSVNVNSVFRGRVLFADFLKGYGLLLIIDHGEDHISLYGHNELLYKKVGDSVGTNELVAKTGVTGGLKSPGLYFEIRKNATPVNPANWCQ